MKRMARAAALPSAADGEVYGYCLGVRSSRKIAQRLVEDVPFRVLAAGNQPDFRTISVRKIHLEALEQLFQTCRCPSCGWAGSHVRNPP